LPARLQERRQDRHRAGGGRQGQNEKYNAARLSEYQRDHSLYIAVAPVD
jgi:hypothetical protein